MTQHDAERLATKYAEIIAAVYNRSVEEVRATRGVGGALLKAELDAIATRYAAGILNAAAALAAEVGQ